MRAARPLPPSIVDSNGNAVLLGAYLGGGKEGKVYEVKHSTSIAAKIYPQPLTKDRTDKVLVMVKMGTEALAKFTSWPIDLLRMKQNSQSIGLLMPRVANSKNVHHLYGPKNRLQDFPKADWRFLVRAATNISRAFAVVHDANCVIGDVNHGSIMVAEDATVMLVDCDSFQVSVSARKFLCEVGVETFTPPELQGKSFRGVVRTPNYDNFGLAVIIFHLLFMGRHPFAGRFRGAGEMPISRAIKECRFPYGGNHVAVQMERPPGTPALSFVGAEVASLYERAFSNATTVGGRPTARDWAAVLLKLETNSNRCATNAGHWHPTQNSQCPWCHMEQLGANPLFPFMFSPVGGQATAFDANALWRQIQGLADLGPAPAIPLPQASPSASARRAGPTNSFANSLAVAIALAVFFGGSYFLPALFWVFGIAAFVAFGFARERLSNAKEIVQFNKALLYAESNFNRVYADWLSRAGEKVFSEARDRLDALRQEFNDISTKRLKALDILEQNQRRLQLDRFLDKFDLEDAKIDGIGPGRKRTLESYGIESAKDLISHKISAVPGFGPVMIERLLKWRRHVEAKFVFDATKLVDPVDVQKVEQEILMLRTKTESATKAAHAEAMQAHARILSIRRNMRKQMDDLQAAVAQARADYEFVKG